jgi:hypothetical protein
MFILRHALIIPLCTLLFISACSKKKERQEAVQQHKLTYLDVHVILGSTPEQLMKRFGNPTQQIAEKVGASIGAITWENIEGVRVFAVIKDGKCAYVHYTFKEMEPFDEDQAFRIIGIERPVQPSKPIPKSQAKWWKPFEQYHKLTVNPEIKGISVMAFPFEM